MSLPVDSRWDLIRQGAPDHTIVVTESAPPNFKAKFGEPVPGAKDPNVFTGEVRTRQHTVLSLREHSDEVNYTAFHLGAKGERDEYAGFYCDVANGVSGTFRLVRRP